MQGFITQVGGASTAFDTDSSIKMVGKICQVIDLAGAIVDHLHGSIQFGFVRNFLSIRF